MGSPIAVIFAHIARAQIRRTGESGWRMATVALVLGYIWLGIAVVLVIIYAVLMARLSGGEF